MICGGSLNYPRAVFPDYCIWCEGKVPRGPDGRTVRHPYPKDHPAPREYPSDEKDQPTAAEVRSARGRCPSCAARRHDCTHNGCTCPVPRCQDGLWTERA